YRIIMKGLGEWSMEQEKMFQDILRGTPLSELSVVEFFPVLKMGMYGPIQTSTLPKTALHKFSLLPLIPGLSENLDKLHEKMMREGIDYHTFTSGSKLNTITGKDGAQPFYSNIQTRTLNDAPFVKNTVFVDYLKYQVKAYPKYKGKISLITQWGALIELGLMAGGKPTDYSGSLLEWDALSETKKRSASNNYKLHSNYKNALDNLIRHHEDTLLKDIGWKRDASGKPVGDMSKL